MRLIDIKNELRQALEFSPTTGRTGKSLANGQSGLILDYTSSDLVVFLSHIRKVAPFLDMADAIVATDLLRITPLGSKIEGEIQTVDALHKQVVMLHTAAANLFHALEQVIEDEDPLSVAISMPEGVTTLEDVEAFVAKAINIFQKPAMRLFGELPQFKGVDAGSAWLTIGYITHAVFGFTVAIIKASHSFCDKRLKLEESAQILRGVGHAMQPLQPAIEKMAEELAKQVVEATQATGDDAEKKLATLRLTTRAIVDLGDLYLRGSAVQLALSAKKEEQTGMPTAKELKQLAVAAKPFLALITDGKGAEPKLPEL